MDLGLVGIIISLIIGIFGIIISVICSYIPKKKQLNVMLLEKELLEAYINIQQLLMIEKELSEECEKGKITVRRNYTIGKICQPKNVEKRIDELTRKLK
mgnify:CR=1 FL=1